MPISTRIWRFWNATPVWIDRWRWNDLLTWSSIEELSCCFTRSYIKFQGHTGQTIADFAPNWAFSDGNSSLSWPMAMEWCTALEVTWEGYPFDFHGHPSTFKVTWHKKHQFWPALIVSGLWFQFEFPDGFEIMHNAWRSLEELPYFFGHPSNF